MTADPYADGVAHLHDELRRLDVLLRLHLERWWADGGGVESRGLYVSEAEIDRLLAVGDPRFGDGGTSADRSDNVDGRLQALEDRIESVTRTVRARERATAETDVDLPLCQVERCFDLGARHRDALLLALAPELDRTYEKVYAYLHDDVTRTRPSVELLLAISCETETQRLNARESFSRRSPLVRHRLIHLLGEQGAPLPARSVAVDNRILEYLLEIDAVAPSLDGVASVREPGSPEAILSADPTLRDEIGGLLKPTDEEERLLAYLHGPSASKIDDAVAAAAAIRDAAVVSADAASLGLPGCGCDGGTLSPGLADDGDPSGAAQLSHPTSATRQSHPRRAIQQSRLAALAREATLRDATIHLKGVAAPTGDGEDGSTPGTLTDVVLAIAAGLRRFDGPVFVSGRRPVSPRLAPRLVERRLATIAFEGASFDCRRERWAAVADLPASLDPAAIAGKFELTLEGIEDALATARAIADGDELTEQALYAGCRAQSREELGSLAQAIETGYTWDDIVLPPDTMAQLREVAAHVEHRGRVYADWGFDEKYSRGNGLTVLFTGPSGTGKTMAAEIVAGEAGLDCYRIDLASVVSKYVGETESNLEAVFDEAEGSNAVLFFDEADALFGERSGVSDAQDRYANVEVSYLLQRVEDHEGTVILASNLEENIDDAFRRRINRTVAFPMPDRDARERIWRSVFPPETPTADLDRPFLATFELSGGNIKNAALTAAFLAAEDDKPVGMEHVVRALRRELEKTGRLVQADDFGEYGEVLRP